MTSEASNADSGNADSGNADSSNADSSNADSSNADSSNADSSNADSGSTRSEAAKSPFDIALDLGLFAPLGFLLEFRRVIPDLAQAGRRQIAFSQTLGRAAIGTVSRARSSNGATPATAAARPAPPVAVSGYDEMAARDIVKMLQSCEPERAAWVAKREAGAKARVTVLRAAKQRSKP